MPRRRDSRRVAFDTARLALARTSVQSAATCREVAERSARICADALEVARVGIWIFDHGRRELRCWALYVRKTGRIESGEVLETRTFPAYCEALREMRVIPADDARRHPATAELTEGYLVRHGITSMLDAPIYREGRLFGVVCHEHVGPPRSWTPDEIGFASGVADVVAAVFEQAERLRAEEALRATSVRLAETAQLETLGRLVRAVSHDLRNVWTALGLALEELGDAADGEAVATARRCLVLGSDLVDALATLQPVASQTSASVGDIVQELRRPLELLVRNRAELSLEIAAPGTVVPLERSDIERIVLNLCMNAHDAMTEEHPGHIAVRVAASDAEVHIEVEDDGEGMDENTVTRAFELRFTTRARGSGIGLSTVLDLVKRANGDITVETAPGEGTLVRVTLPVVRSGG